jgi:oligopeptidase B
MRFTFVSLTTAIIISATTVLAMSSRAFAQNKAAAPPTAEQRVRVDTLHGIVRTDPYFWLRHKSDPAVAAYLERENLYAEQTLAPLKGLREQLYNEMLSRIQQTDLSVPYFDNGYFYYTRTEAGKQYQIHARKQESLSAPEEVLLDVNALAAGQSFMSVGVFRPSDNAQLLAYTTDTTGFRQYTLYIKDLRTGKLLADRAQRVVTAAWANDSKTLFYTVEDSVTKRSHRLYRHVLGTPEHTLLYEEPDERFSVYVRRTRSDQYILAEIGSLTATEVRYLKADQPTGEFKQIAARVPNREYYVDHHGEHFYIQVNDRGRNFRLARTPVQATSEANWTEVIPHRSDVMLEQVSLFRNHLVSTERRGALPRIVIRDLRTNQTHDVAFPEPVYSTYLGNNAEFDTGVLRYSYESFLTPSSLFDYDMNARTSKLLKQQPVLGDFDPSRYTSERIWARARDGTQVPISLVYRRGTARDGSAPMLLTAYGSYGAPYDVYFDSNQLSLLDRGVVFALAHIRGGGDMGKNWHDQGRMQHKMNTFTDFIDAAEHLIAEKYTSPRHLVIEGISAGGLLMGAVTNMRPELFRAVIAHVPFVDAINTMLDESLPLTVGEFEEWGNPKLLEQYQWIAAYDPYANVAAKNYPAMLVKTSFNDSQVMYHEPAKWVARLRAMKTDQNPLLLVTNMGAGHGGASGRYDRLREIALDYAFVLWQVGLVPGAAL